MQRGLKQVAKLHLDCARADDTFSHLLNSWYAALHSPLARSADDDFFTLVQQDVSHGVFSTACTPLMMPFFTFTQ
jgi:hypothetical protein